MNDVEDLVIENDPKIQDNKLILLNNINENEEISISINNSVILDKEDILKVYDNIIELSYDIDKKDIIVVIYNKIGE